MRWIFEHPEEARATGQRARAAMCDGFTWDQAALAIRNAAQALGEPALRSPGLTLNDLVGLAPRPETDLSQDSLGSAVLARLAELEEADDVAAAVLAELRMHAPQAPGRRTTRRSPSDSVPE
jgi:hypothetical protein